MCVPTATIEQKRDQCVTKSTKNTSSGFSILVTGSVPCHESAPGPLKTMNLLSDLANMSSLICSKNDGTVFRTCTGKSDGALIEVLSE